MKDKGKSDAEKLAAAALSIRVGGFQDPEDLSGFSHFLEHMVFMGSEKYKSENEFDDFVTVKILLYKVYMTKSGLPAVSPARIFLLFVIFVVPESPPHN